MKQSTITDNNNRPQVQHSSSQVCCRVIMLQRIPNWKKSPELSLYYSTIGHFPLNFQYTLSTGKITSLTTSSNNLWLELVMV